jgi:hypothetical protein
MAAPSVNRKQNAILETFTIDPATLSKIEDENAAAADWHRTALNTDKPWEASPSFHP